MTNYENHIISVVDSKQGIKNVDLALAVMTLIGPGNFDVGLFAEALEVVIREEKIIEIEYILPNISYRVKSFYLPAGTKIRK